MRTAIALFFIVATSCSVEAAIQYSMIHNADGFGNTGPIDVIDPRSAPINYSFSGVTDFQGRNRGEVQVNVNQGSIGIHAETHNNGLFAPQRQEVTARVQFDTIFSSTGSSPVGVIMNLDLSGTIAPAQFIYSSVQVNAGTISSFSGGTYSDSLNPSSPVLRDGMLSGFSASGSVESVSTGVIQVPVNVPVTMFLSLKTIQTYDTVRPRIDFGNTFNLTRFGDVFTIQGPNASEVFSVDSIDAGIVNNRFHSNVVPEPSSFALLGLGSLGLLATVRKRKLTRRVE